MKSVWIRMLAAVLMLCLLFGCSPSESSHDASGASDKAESGSEKPSGEITLAFVENDSLNPYEAKTKSNQEIVNLMYDGLVKLNENFEPVNVIADSINVSGNVCTVHIRSDVRFTDGSRVTAEDAAYSLEKARNAEGTKYISDLDEVSSVSADGQTLKITLSNDNSHFVNMLDFPVFKKGTDGKQNSDKKSIPPVGSGRYELFQTGGEYHLEANSSWIGGTVHIAKIMLANLPDDAAVKHAISVGSIDIYYSDLSDNAYPSMKGTALSVVSSNLVYLGSGTSGSMKNLDIRRAVSLALDREEIVNSVFFGSATAAKGPYHSNISEVEGLQTLSTKKNTDEAVKSLANAGYSTRGDDGLLLNGSKKLNIKTIYYSGSNSKKLLADRVVASLRAVGIDASSEGLDWDMYQSYIKNGYYDLYIGEIKIPADLDIYSLVTAGGLISPKLSETDTPSADDNASKTDSESVLMSDETSNISSDADEGFSQKVEEKSVSAELALYNLHIGKGSVSEAVSCLNEQLPIIPICHRSGVVIYSSRLSQGLDPVSSDPFRGIENCRVV